MHFPLTPVVDCIFLDHVLHGVDYVCIIRDEFLKEVYLAQERLHGFLISWVSDFCNILNSVQIHLDVSFGNNVSNKVPLKNYEYALFGIQGNPVSPALPKNFLQMEYVVFSSS